MNSEIRAATLVDAEGIAHVHVEAWRWAYDGLMPAELLAGLSVASRTRQWQGQLSAGSSTVFVAEQSGRTVGFVSFGPSRDPYGHGEVYAIYLLSDARGLGIGSGLWEQAADSLRNQGFLQVQVWVLESNLLAREFYERKGLYFDGARKTSQWAGTSLCEVSYCGSLT